MLREVSTLQKLCFSSHRSVDNCGTGKEELEALVNENVCRSQEQLVGLLE